MSEPKYTLTVGLEIHAELKTRTKMFCDSKNDSDEKRPNVNVCPICLGHPGTLPVINKEAVKHALRVGVAVQGELADFTEFDRKNYFYPDIPKGYQISQYKYPLVSGGVLNGVAITRVHLEEDTGTLIHADTETQINADTIRDNQRPNPRQSASLVDFNRAGVPLMELVTEPVIHSVKGAGDFARELQLLLRYLGASDANMEKGEMRIEANISVAKLTEIADSRGLPDTRINADKEAGKLLYEDLSYKVRGAIFNVRNALGPGHKESVYQNSLAEEFFKSKLSFEREKQLNIIYEDKKVGVYIPDFVVDDKILVELKTLPFTGLLEKKQVYTYLKGSKYKLAFLVNFGSSKLQIDRIVFDTIRENPRLNNPRESAPLGTKVEVKNLNSFRSVERAIAYELERQIELLEAGEKVMQETRGWDDGKQATYSQRMKEESHDYRYFPDPDLPKLMIREIPEFSPANLNLPELPKAKRERYQRDFGITGEASSIFIEYRKAAVFLESVAGILKDAPSIALAVNYITSDLLGLAKTAGDIDEVFSNFKFNADDFSALISMIQKKELSSRGAKDVLAVMYVEGGEPGTIARARGLMQKNDEEELQAVVQGIIDAHAKVVADYKNGKESALQFLVGQGMKATKDSANPEMLKDIIKEILARRS